VKCGEPWDGNSSRVEGKGWVTLDFKRKGKGDIICPRGEANVLKTSTGVTVDRKGLACRRKENRPKFRSSPIRQDPQRGWAKKKGGGQLVFVQTLNVKINTHEKRFQSVNKKKRTPRKEKMQKVTRFPAAKTRPPGISKGPVLEGL